MNVLAIFAVLSVVGAVIGYTTKWTSVQLIFRPSTYVGIGRLGWQGVVQRRSPKFALGIADTLRVVAPLDRMLERIDSEELAALVMDALGERLDDVAPEVMEGLSPGVWTQAPDQVRDLIRTQLRREAAGTVLEVIEEARSLLPGIMDFDSLALDLFSGQNSDRLARLIRKIGDRELRVVVLYGAFVGFFVGLVEALVYLAFDRWWLLPAIGALDGLVNNWMGIQMIFRPLEAKRYLGLFRYQGLFPARQAQIAHDYAQMMAAEVLSPVSVGVRLQKAGQLEPVSKAAYEILRQRIRSQVVALAPLFGLTPSPDLEHRILEAATSAVAGGGIPLEDLSRVTAYLEDRLQVAATIEDELASMSKQDFEGILRGIFEEDEPLLVGIGGVIGALIGCLQAVLVLGLHLG